MDSLINGFSQFGLIGLVVGFLFLALFQLHKSDTTQTDKLFDLCLKLVDLFSSERNHNNERINELANSITELASKLPSFCGERRKKIDD